MLIIILLYIIMGGLCGAIASHLIGQDTLDIFLAFLLWPLFLIIMIVEGIEANM